MEIKIGIQHAQRELTVETTDSADEVQGALAAALADNGVFTLTDTKGRVVAVPAARLNYLEIGPTSHGTVGFR